MQLIREIYKEMICSSKYMAKVEKAVSEEMKRLTDMQKNRMTQTEYEEFRGLLFDIAMVAQEEAFVAGVRYATTMLIQNLADVQD